MLKSTLENNYFLDDKSLTEYKKMMSVCVSQCESL